MTTKADLIAVSDKEFDTYLDELLNEGVGDLLNQRDIKEFLVNEIYTFTGNKWSALLIFQFIRMFANKTDILAREFIKAKLKAAFKKYSPLGELLRRFLDKKDTSANEEALLEALRQQRRGNSTQFTKRIENIDTLSLEVQLALSSADRLGGLESKLGTDANLLEDVKKAIDDAFQQHYSPQLRWQPEEAERTNNNHSVFSGLIFEAEVDRFIGREPEIELLTDFCGDIENAASFQWLLITGKGGNGKSRLAWHFVREELPNIWRHSQEDPPVWLYGRLAKDKINTFIEHADRWQPRQPTFIVIDYAQGMAQEVGQLLDCFCRQQRTYLFPLRLLVLEREADDIWLNKMINYEGGKERTLACHYNVPELWHDGRKGYELKPLAMEHTLGLMRERFITENKPVPNDEQLRTIALKVEGISEDDFIKDREQTLPRALYAIAAATVFAQRDDSTPPALSKYGVLKAIVDRERNSRWQEIGNDDHRKQYEILLALSTICQGFELNHLSEKVKYPAIVPWLPETGPNLNDDALEIIGKRDNTVLPLEPDILGEFFVLDCARNYLDITTNGETDALFLFALNVKAFETLFFIFRVIQDFPEDWRLTSLRNLLKDENWKDNHLRALLLLQLVVNLTALTSEDWIDELQSLFVFIKNVGTHFCNSPEIALHSAMAATNIANHAGEQQRWDDVAHALERIDAAMVLFKDNQEIALASAKAATNIANHAGEQQRWDDVAHALERIDAAMVLFKDNQEIALASAKAATNIANHAGKQKQWDDVAKALERIDAAMVLFKDNQEIALRSAMAAFNITYHAGEQQRWDDVAHALERIDAAMVLFKDNQEIALHSAMAATNIANHAGKQQRWDDVAKALERIDAAMVLFKDNQEIALESAKAAFNITNHAGEQQRWDDVAHASERIDAAMVLFKDNQEIALRSAMAATNITNHAGEQQRWDDVAKALERIDAAMVLFKDNQEIALASAKAAFNIANHAGKQQRWDDVARALERIDAAMARFGDNQEIALHSAMAATNITNHAGEQQQWDDVAKALERIDAAMVLFKDNQEIALESAKVAFNITYHAWEQQRWDDVAHALERIDAAMVLFKDNQEIALASAKAAFNITYHAWEQQRWDDVAHALERIDAAMARFGDNMSIIDCANKACLSIFYRGLPASGSKVVVKSAQKLAHSLRKRLGSEYVVLDTPEHRQITVNDLCQRLDSFDQPGPPSNSV